MLNWLMLNWLQLSHQATSTVPELEPLYLHVEFHADAL